MSATGEGPGGSRIVGVGEYATRLREECRWCAPRRGNLVITGEPGSGKGAVLDEIQQLLRPDVPFLRVGVPDMVPSLRQTQLNGHVRGMFSGADRSCSGLFQAYDGGVIAFEHADSLEFVPEIQQSVLDVGEGRSVLTLGRTKPDTPRVRLITVFQKPLAELVEKGAIRADLAERLNRYSIACRPLREHSEDIPALTLHMLRLVAREEEFPMLPVPGITMTLLRRYGWPGNVRQLGNVMGRALSAAIRDGATEILPRYLPELAELAEDIMPSVLAESVSSVAGGNGRTRNGNVRLTEDLVRQALGRTGNNARKASELLGCSERNVWYWIRKCRIALRPERGLNLVTSDR